jgi:regulator of sirC expression with transglutaminase-like and TPR domain
LLAAWLAIPVAPAGAAGPTGKTALTLTLSQREKGPSARNLSLSEKESGPWDAASCRLEARLFADAAGGRLHEFSALDAALVAGGIDSPDSLRRYQQKAAALVDQLRSSATLGGTPRQQVEAVFEFLHERVLYGGYDLAYSDLRRVLDDGRFNCVSATVLMNYLAGQLGLDCRGLEMPGHAMTRVRLADGALDIETTCPHWFSLRNDFRQSAIATKTIGAAAGGDRSKAREVSPVQMAAMIYYNRGVDLLSEKRFAEAARANAKALKLDPRNATARGNLLATINNWAIDLSDSQRFVEAVELLRRGLSMDAKFEPFAQNYVHVHSQWVDQLCREKRFEEASQVLSRATAEMPGRDYLRKAQDEVRQRWAKAVAAAPQGSPLPKMAKGQGGVPTK